MNSPGSQASILKCSLTFTVAWLGDILPAPRDTRDLEKTRRPLVRTLVVGARNPAEMVQAREGLGIPIPADSWVALGREPLVDPSAPVPGDRLDEYPPLV